MNLLCVLLVLGSASTISSARSSINISTLLDAYTLTCGQQFCNYHDHSLPDTSHHHHICPRCVCDPFCILFGICCLDVYLSLNFECINTTFISYSDEDFDSVDEDSFVMRAFCPESADAFVKQKCEGSQTFSEQLQLLPVTSKDTQYTYKNKFCADCYNDSNVEKWVFSATCQQFVDFNFISSYDEVFQVAQKKGCKLGSSPHEMYVRGFHDDLNKQEIISSCNVSGTWMTYDPSIDWACKNYDHLYRVFRNVFCYVCNPPVSLNPVISHCNSTGLWDKFDDRFIHACENLDYTPTTHPFKNTFCYSCNVAFNTNAETKFKDHVLMGQITEAVNKTQFLYYFEFRFLADDFNQMELYNISTNQSYIQGEHNDMEDIYKQFSSTTGNGDICTNISDLIKPDGRCSCDEYCHFNHTHPCCIDRIFRNSTTCINTDRGNFLAYNGCENVANGYGPLADKCLSDNANGKVMYSTPVSSVHPPYPTYKNIFCGLCRHFTDNSKSMNKFTISEFDPWYWKLVCKASLPVPYHISLSELLELQHYSNCNFSFEPRGCQKSCTNNVVLQKRVCNISKNHGIGWACENYNSPPYNIDYYHKMNDSALQNYSNIFCAIYQTDTNVSLTLIDSCNVTGGWDKHEEQIKQKCLHLPTVAYHMPYKNIFCKMCNENSKVYNTSYTTEPKCNTIISNPPNTKFRTLFSLSVVNGSDVPSSSQTCRKDQMFDSQLDMCRNILCFPGRVLVNETCIPIIPSTINLGYNISVGLDMSLSENVDSPLELMELLRHKILNHLNLLLDYSFVIEIIVMSANRPCNVKDVWTNGHLHVSIFLKIFSWYHVNRVTIEERLIRFMKFKLFLNFRCLNDQYCSTECVFNFDEQALNLQTLQPNPIDENNCTLYQVNHVEEADNFIHQQVSNLLKCPQIQLEDNEFKVSHDGLQIKLTRHDIYLKYYDFFRISSNSTRICLSKFQALLESINKQTKSPLIQQIMFYCTVISLMALVFTFMTYCLFPKLRTLPGKNNMNLTFALFFSFGCLEFGIDKINNKVLCKILGTCIHFFWLSSFCCLNVCSFHMYRTFRKTSTIRLSDQSKENKVLIYNLIYSYVVPLLIVGINVLLSSTLWDNNSYGYGGKKCFISNRLAVICTFIAPITLICFVNVVFFILASYGISSPPHLCPDETFKQNKTDFTVYLKLFILTGSSWILQIADSFFPLSYFSVAVSFLSSFQGLYLFLAYICNKRVLNMYRSLFIFSENKPNKFQISNNTSESSLQREIDTENKNM